MPTSKKLLIRLSSAGDVLLTSPLLKIMKEREPDSEIHFVVRAQYADLIRYNPNVNVVHLVQNNADIHELERLRQNIIHEGFDITLDLQSNFRSVYLRKGSAKKVKVIKKEVFKRALLVRTKLNLYSKVRSVALKYAQVYDKAITEVPRPEIFFAKETKERIDKLWEVGSSGSEKSVFLCPGAKHFTKRWPVEYWKKLARKVSEQYRIVLVGGEEDAEICQTIEKYADVTNLCGKLTLIESTAMLSHADLVITNDSYLMHAANALGKKIVAIFGSTVREFGFFPYGVNHKIIEAEGLPCRPCSHIGRESCPKKHFRCMMEARPDRVYETAMELLEA